MTVTIVVGTQWGDEGKGKIVDFIAPAYDAVARSQGGHNAGHTVYVDGVKYPLHHIPSGIISGKICIMGNGVIFDPRVMLKELENLEKKGIDTRNLYLSSKAHTIFPYHNVFDGIRGGKVGTTKRGTGPCYADKIERTGIRAEDLLLPEDELRRKIEEALEDKNFLLEHKYGLDPFDPKELARDYAELGTYIGDRITDTSKMLHDMIDKGMSIILEGAQGTYLDIDHGTYPFVTSSNSTAGGACTGSGVGPKDIDRVIGVAKAYVTRVGNGPFPTELGNDKSEEFKAEEKESKGKTQEQIIAKFTDSDINTMLSSGDAYLMGKGLRIKGAEYGTTTGRPRRVGWPDFNMLVYSRDINSIGEWAVTKLDVLNGIRFKIATEYEKGGDSLIPDYGERTYGWPELSDEDTERIISDGFSAMPEGMQEYLIKIAEFTKVPVRIASLSADRKHTVEKDLFTSTLGYI